MYSQVQDRAFQGASQETSEVNFQQWTLQVPDQTKCRRASEISSEAGCREREGVQERSWEGRQGTSLVQRVRVI